VLFNSCQRVSGPFTQYYLTWSSRQHNGLSDRGVLCFIERNEMELQSAKWLVHSYMIFRSRTWTWSLGCGLELESSLWLLCLSCHLPFTGAWVSGVFWKREKAICGSVFPKHSGAQFPTIAYQNPSGSSTVPHCTWPRSKSVHNTYPPPHSPTRPLPLQVQGCLQL
jgi:hypothetical protein